MKERLGNSRPTRFEVALEKGDFQLPSEVPRKQTFEEALEAFITFYERIGCPDIGGFYWLGIWKACHRDRKKTARALENITEEGIKKRLARLKKNYEGSGPGPHRPKKMKKR